MLIVVDHLLLYYCHDEGSRGLQLRFVAECYRHCEFDRLLVKAQLGFLARFLFLFFSSLQCGNGARD